MDILKIYTLNMLLHAFGGTCPITPDSPTAGSSVAVNRPPVVAPTCNNTSLLQILQQHLLLEMET
jgi:hypothetical protein